MKLSITIGVTVGALLFGWIGAAIFDHGNQLGGWSLLFSTIGSFVGIWAGYKIAKNYL
jgi:uncharacterized membrane protein YeaQ/YmgE (transglycosylase-associated protein family)